MELTNTFVIAAPFDEVWQALTDPRIVAPCFPGASLTDYTGDSFSGAVRVKLGPVSLKYLGTGTYVQRDETARTVVIEALGKDTNGNGSARAMVTGTMIAHAPGETAVTMVTDLAITGRPAQFGRGIMTDMADKIISQFSTLLASRINGEEPDHVAVTAPEGDTEAIDVLDVMGPALRRIALAAVAAVTSAAVTVALRKVRAR